MYIYGYLKACITITKKIGKNRESTINRYGCISHIKTLKRKNNEKKNSLNIHQKPKTDSSNSSPICSPQAQKQSRNWKNLKSQL